MGPVDYVSGIQIRISTIRFVKAIFSLMKSLTCFFGTSKEKSSTQGKKFPGCSHDSRVAAESGLYRPLMDEKIPSVYCFLADSAFPKDAKDTNGKISCSRKENEVAANVGVSPAAVLEAVEVLIY